VGPRTGLDVCGKYRPPPGFDPLTVQPVASSYIVFKEPTTGRHNLLKGGGTSQASIHAFCSTGHGLGNGALTKGFIAFVSLPHKCRECT
jgi:hypothetical protein